MSDSHPYSSTIEIMAPAGSWESLHAAIQAGADSVYFGAGNLQMRTRSAAFGIDEIGAVVQTAHGSGKKAYLTLNTLIYDEEEAELERILEAAGAASIDAVIAADPWVLERAASKRMPIHLSTQANAANAAAVRLYSRWADVMVLARELTLPQTRAIIESITAEDIRGPSGKRVRVEVFVHGALCVAISGKCYMSLAQHNTSANRGDCYQMCRRKYTVTDAETGFAYNIDNQWVMSPKDLCTLPVLNRILDAGVTVLKIEGRGRSPDYVNTVVGCYRRAVEAWRNNAWTEDFVAVEMELLNRVFNRGFWVGGYYLGEKLDPWARSSGNKATLTKTYIGKVEKYYKRSGIAQIRIEAESYQLGMPLLITGKTSGVVEAQPESFQVDDTPAELAPQKSVMTFPLHQIVRPGDKVYRLDASEKR